jgi:transposase
VAGKKGRSGAKGKLTPEVQERIIQAIRGGNYIEVAARYAGIDPVTFYNWMKWGEEKGEGVYFNFFNAVKNAEALSEAEAVAQVRLASRNEKNWAAGMTWLERRFQQRWSRTDRQEHSGEVKIVMVDETSDKDAD